MVRKHKLYQRIVNSQKNVRFADFQLILEAFGFTLDRISGSHHVYVHLAIPQSIPVQPDQHNQAKPYQVKQFLHLVKQYKLTMTTGGDEE